MGILDDAIKEHLELKRQHGAAEPELKQLEDEAFGAAERPGDEKSAPDPLAEAPTEFMTPPDLPPPADEAKAPPGVESAPPATDEAAGRPQPRAEIADLQEGPAGSEPAEAAPLPEEPAEEESPAMEHEAISEPAEAELEPEITGPSTEEREAIAEQPTEMFDVEGEIAASQPSAEPAGKPDVDFDDEEDDDFWSEQRLSDELDQALEAPAEDEDEIFDEDEADEAPPAEEPVPPAQEPEPPAEEQPRQRHDEDVLEETPDFLEEAPEDDQLWFEQKPPKDFDFDD